MANKKISELESRASLSLSDLMAVGDPSTGYLYKTTISDLKTLTGAGVVSFNGRFGTVNPAEGDYTLTQLGDVIITSPSNTQLLQYNGSNWVNWTPNYVTAQSGTANYIAKWGASSVLADSVIYETGGNISIGSNNPFGYKLNVQGTMRIAAPNDGQILFGNQGNSYPGISLNGSLNTQDYNFTSNSSDKTLYINTPTGYGIRFLQNNESKMFLAATGNLLINTSTDAGHKLAINGGFKSSLSAGHFVELDHANYRYLVNISNTQTLQDSENISFTVNGTGIIAFQTALVNRFVVNNTGTITISSLAGSGSRMVVADANGVLSTQAIPSTTGFVTLDTFQTITASKTFSVGFSLASAGGSNQLSAFANTNSIHSGSAGSNIFGFNNSNNIYFGKGLSNGGVIAWNNSTVRSYTLPNADGTIALTSDIPSLSNYVTLDGTQTITGAKTFSTLMTAQHIKANYYGFPDSNGYSTGFESTSNNTIQVKIGSGLAINIGSNNNATFYGNIIRNGGTSSQFLKADGSLDSSTYLTSSSLSGYVTGSGTTNFIPKFTGSGSIGNSIASESGNVFIISTTGESRVNLRSASGNGIALTFTESGVADRYLIGSPASNGDLVFRSGAFNFSSGSETMRLTAGGLLGLGTTSPITLMHLNGSTAALPATTGTTQSAGHRMRLSTAAGTGVLDMGCAGGTGMWFQSTDLTDFSLKYPLLLNPNGGNVGIGTTNPTKRLDIYDNNPNGTDDAVRIYQDVTTNHAWYRSQRNGGANMVIGATRSNVDGNISGNVSLLWNYTAHDMVFGTNSSERMRISSDGNVGIGTTNTASTFLNIANTGTQNELMFRGTAYTNIFSETTNGLQFGISSTGSSAAIEFLTNNSERMRISSGGDIGIGISSPGTMLHIQAAARSYGLFRITSTTGSTGEASMNFGRSDQAIDNRWTVGQGTAGVGDTFGFYTAGSNKATLTTAGVWSTIGGGTSDLRTKQDIEYNFDNGIESVLKLQPTKFKFKNAPDKQRRGFIAQDVLQVIPDLVLGDGQLKDGTYGLDYDGILALAVKAIQEQQVQIEKLKAQLK